VTGAYPVLLEYVAMHRRGGAYYPSGRVGAKGIVDWLPVYLGHDTVTNCLNRSQRP
jgi:hypothetical protein